MGLIYTEGFSGLGGPERTYYKAINPTIGTGVAMGIQTSYSTTNNILAMIRNTTDIAVANTRVFPHYIRLICTAVGVSITASDIVINIDSANRYSSGGVLLTGNCSDTQVTTTSIADVRLGAITGTSSTTAIPITRARVKTDLAGFAIGDEILILFTSEGIYGGSLQGSAASKTVITTGPCCLEPGNSSMSVHMWNKGNLLTPPSWECEFAWWER